MPSLPIISGSDAVRALQRLGFIVVRQQGSHNVCFARGPKVVLCKIIVKSKQVL